MVKTLLFFINEWGNIVVPFDLLEGISSKKGVGLQHWGEAKRCCFAVTIPSTPYFIKPSLFRTLQFKTTKSSKNV